MIVLSYIREISNKALMFFVYPVYQHTLVNEHDVS